MSEWISVKESLPVEGACVLAMYDTRVYCIPIVCRRVMGEWRECWYNSPAPSVTHWMPLPDQPPVTTVIHEVPGCDHDWMDLMNLTNPRPYGRLCRLCGQIENFGVLK